MGSQEPMKNMKEKKYSTRASRRTRLYVTPVPPQERMKLRDAKATAKLQARERAENLKKAIENAKKQMGLCEAPLAFRNIITKIRNAKKTVLKPTVLVRRGVSRLSTSTEGSDRYVDTEEEVLNYSTTGYNKLAPSTSACNAKYVSFFDQFPEDNLQKLLNNIRVHHPTPPCEPVCVEPSFRIDRVCHSPRPPLSPAAPRRQGFLQARLAAARQNSITVSTKRKIVRFNKNIAFLSSAEMQTRQEQCLQNKEALDKDYLKRKTMLAQTKDVNLLSSATRDRQRKRWKQRLLWAKLVMAVQCFTTFCRNLDIASRKEATTSSPIEISIMAGGNQMAPLLSAIKKLQFTKQIKPRYKSWGPVRIVLRWMLRWRRVRNSVSFITYFMISWSDMQPLLMVCMTYHAKVRVCQLHIKNWIYSHKVRKMWLRRAWDACESSILEKVAVKEKQFLDIPASAMPKEYQVIRDMLTKRGCAFVNAKPFKLNGRLVDGTLAHLGIGANESFARVCPKMRNKFITDVLREQYLNHCVKLDVYLEAKSNYYYTGLVPHRPYRSLTLPSALILNLVKHARQAYSDSLRQQRATALLANVSNDFFLSILETDRSRQSAIYDKEPVPPLMVDSSPRYHSWVSHFITKHQHKLVLYN